MLRFLLRKKQVPQRQVTEPAQFIDRRTVKISIETIQRLEYLSGRGAWLREQMEACAEECCFLLGCDYDCGGIDSEIASEIIYCGVEVGEALDRILEFKSGGEE
jgi:hypothetical protein